MHPGRTGRAHLRIGGPHQRHPGARVEEVIEQVGLGGAARRRIKGYSLGMRQRLGIAAALLGDPRVLLFDEPVNGLDLDGVRWIRALLRELADEGRTVLVSSHLMSEMQLTADRLVVIGRGRLIADADDRGGAARPGRPAGAGAHPVRRRARPGLDGAARPVERTAPDELEVDGLRRPRSGDSPTRSASRCTTSPRSSSRSSRPTSS